MRIISSFMDDLVLVEKQCHTIFFESSRLQMKFRGLIKNYFSNKKMDDRNYLDLLDKNNQSISPKQFYFIEFECFTIDLKDEKDTSKLLLNLLEHELEHNAELLGSYTEYLAVTDKFISQLELNDGEFKIEFQVTEKTIEALLKSLIMTIEYNDDELVANHRMRELLINAMMKLNLTEKEVVLLLSFPEVDIGFRDYKQTIQFIEELGITVVVLSANSYFITHPEVDCTFLINKNGEKYDIPFLAEELIAFDLVSEFDAKEIAKELAYKDFTKDYLLLDPLYKEFLISNRENL